MERKVNTLKGSGLKKIPKASGKVLPLYDLSVNDKISMVREGVSRDYLTAIKAEAELDYNQLASILSVSRAKLLAIKEGQRFDSQTSERILMLSDVIAYGREVFGDNDIFNGWLKSPSEALGNVSPLSMMDTLYGIEEVKREIGRIEYGIY